MTYHWKTEVAILENRIHLLEQRGDNVPIVSKRWAGVGFPVARNRL